MQEAAWKAKKEADAKKAAEAAAAELARKADEDKRKAADGVAEIKGQYAGWREGAAKQVAGRWRTVPSVSGRCVGARVVAGASAAGGAGGCSSVLVAVGCEGALLPPPTSTAACLPLQLSDRLGPHPRTLHTCPAARSRSTPAVP